ncbi:MAG: Ig-like domain repeat protein, partial [Rudaea sp.]
MRLPMQARARSTRHATFVGLFLAICLQPAAALAQQNLSMTMTGPATASAYQQLSYSLTITNTGSNDTGFFDIVDVLPAGATFVKSTGFPRSCFATGQSVDCNGSFVGVSVPVGSPLVVTITVAANGAASCAALTNSATLTINDGSGKTVSTTPVVTTLTGCNPATTTSIAALNPIVVGSSAWVAANVTAANGAVPAGSVTINDTTDALSCTYVLGVVPAGCAISMMSLGAKQLTATYSGGYGLLGSTSATTSLTVSPGYTSLQPARLLDTRSSGVTIDHLYQGVGSVPAGGQISLAVLNRGGVPASNVDAVVLNLAAVNPTAASYATVWPTGASRPLAANLNYVAGLTIPNLVIGKVGTNGKVSIYNNTGSADFV